MLDIKALLAKIVQRLYPTTMFKITNVDSEQQNIAANTNGEFYFSGTNNGYYPLGVIGWHCVWISGQTSLINIYLLNVDQRSNGSCRIHCAYRNMHTAQTQWKLQAFVLWVKI